jgi:hypothetical protein
MCLFLVLPAIAAGQTVIAGAQRPAANINTVAESLNFLVGTWLGEGTAETGQGGGGSCSFEMELQGKVLIRKNKAEYPADKGHPTITHDDLMIIYPDRATGLIRAFYTDNEGNVIHYTVTAAADGKGAVFLGDEEPGAPRYRLTYTVTQPDHMTVVLEVVAHATRRQFQKIIEGKLQRSGTATN